ncbi:BfmA/BtgA family mobilization protein [Sphingobacterium sp. Mn56C]|uniref:BfmA/BtgA family mobilization protein n=1 Tax=Sphingobacterium sp. Mn56C TaxID=3395261 RepID=UPI003BBEDE36
MMSKVDENCKSIRFPVKSDEKLSLLARKLGRSKRKLTMDMIDYFYKSKKDPTDLSDELLKRELSSGISRIISFIKTQETDLLIPMYSELEGLSKSSVAQRTVMEEVNGKLPLVQESVDKSSRQVSATGNKLDLLITKTNESKILKLKFLKLFDDYASQRESLGWSSSATKRDELLKQFRAAIYAL